MIERRENLERHRTPDKLITGRSKDVQHAHPSMLFKSPFEMSQLSSCMYQQSRARSACQLNLCKYHALMHSHHRYLPVVNNPRLVHHMILFSCASPPVQTGDVFECLTMDDGCQTFMIGWAPGIKAVDLPATAGTVSVNGWGHVGTWPQLVCVWMLLCLQNREALLMHNFHCRHLSWLGRMMSLVQSTLVLSNDAELI